MHQRELGFDDLLCSDAEVTERIGLLCRLGEGVCSAQILFEGQCLGLISEEL